MRKVVWDQDNRVAKVLKKCETFLTWKDGGREGCGSSIAEQSGHFRETFGTGEWGLVCQRKGKC